ncbi:MAG: DNA polymerase I, partial [Bdellovibrionota bacterium]
MQKKPLLCLIDASSFIFRAFYAVRHLSNKSGLPTNAVFGFASMILKVLEDVRPTHIAVIYDTKHPSFRKEMYKEYKANRSAMPEELVPQIPYIKKFVETLGLPAFEQAGFEADDLIATLAHQAADLSKEHPDVCIVSSDKDLMQLVTEKVYLYDTMKDQRYYAPEVKEKLGVLPELVPDFLGIVGDTSDNIPGVKGIGPKGAVALLEQFGSMEEIYKNIEEVKKEGQRKTLIECKELAILSKELATVKRDLKIDTDWHSLRCEPKASEEFFTLLHELEFQNLEKKMRAWAMPEGARSSRHEPGKANNAVIAPAPPFDPESDSEHVTPAAAPANDEIAAAKKEYVVVTEITHLEKIFKSLSAVKEIAIDTETTSLEVHDAAVVGFSFCADGKTAYYVPVGHLVSGTDYRCEGQCAAAEALKLFANFLEGKKILGQNLKYDLNVLRAAGIELKPEQIWFDTMIASYILTPDGRHNLDLLSGKYLGHSTIKYEDITGTGKAQISFAHAEISKAGEYAAEDAHVAYLLAQKLRAELAKVPGLEKVFREIDMPLVSVLAAMEWEGVAIDVPLLKELSEKFAITLGELEKEAHKLAGGEFNLGSPKQLQKILFEDLKLPTFKKTKTGFSTDVDVLQKLSSLHPLPALILEVRELSKLKGTYVDVLPTLVHPKTGRVHAHFNQTVAATGRLSSSDPNLQNIPIRTESGRLVRKAFIARKGWSLLGADYSQIELRILASMSGD